MSNSLKQQIDTLHRQFEEQRVQISELRATVAVLWREHHLNAPFCAGGDLLLTPKMVAHITGLSRSAVQKRIKSGKLRVAQRRGGRVFIDPASLPKP
jgi:hypothetical protein